MQPDWNKVKAIRLMKSGGWRTWLWRHRSTYFAAVHVLDGRFAESEVDVVAVGERTGEVGCCVQKQKTIVSIQTSLCAPLGCSKNPARVLEESLAGLWHIPPVIKNFLKILFRMFWCAYKRQPQPKTCRNGQIPPKWQFFMIIISIIAITNQEKKTILEMSLPLSLVASYCSDRRGSRRIRGSIPEKSATVPAYSCSSVPQKIIHKKKKIINQSLRPSPNGNSLIYRRTRTCCCAKDRKDWSLGRSSFCFERIYRP